MYSVRGSTEGLQSKNINGTWDYNFKWKPPEENTIDFLVKVKKTVEDARVMDQIIPLIEMNNGVKTMNDYKQLELYVGYDEIEDDTIDYCRRVLEGKRRDYEKEKIKRFNHHNKEGENYDTTNIKLVGEKMLCLNHDEDEIRDGDLVEMRFNKVNPATKITIKAIKVFLFRLFIIISTSLFLRHARLRIEKSQSGMKNKSHSENQSHLLKY